MTPRERILTAFKHQLPDRTPADGWFHAEVVKNLLAFYGTDNWDEVERDLGVDGWAACGPKLVNPEFEKKADVRSFKGMERRGIWQDERTYVDGLGVMYGIGESGWYEEWITGPLVNADAEDLAAITDLAFPRVDHIVEPPGIAATIRALKEDGQFVTCSVSNPYKTAWQLRGMDNVLVDYLINRPFLEALYDRLYEVLEAQVVCAVRAGVDMISVIGDVAMQDRIIMGPDTWRAVDKPRMARMIAACKAVNPDVFLFIHSDGNVMDLMDDIVEIGFDIVNPIQPECMDPVEVKRRWGDRITLHGGISLQQTLPNGTVQEVRAEVDSLVRECGYNGGLVVFPSNVIQPDTPCENIIACYHAARDYDLSAFR